MTKPIIVVFGATGKSGGGMVDYILKDGTFAARGVTRDPESRSAKALAARGVEVVQADLSQPETLVKAMEGAYGVFGVTDFWQAFMAEEQQGKDMVNAAKQAGIKHFVWTTLDYSEWHVPHFETKARVNDYLIESGLPRTSLYLSFFVENLKGAILSARHDHSGARVLDVRFKTDGKIPVISAFDIGGWALVAFKNPDEWIGKDMKIVAEWVTIRDVAKIMEEELGEKVHVKEIDEHKWNSLRSEDFEELWLNMQTFYTAGPGYRDVELSNTLLPGATKMRDAIREWTGQASKYERNPS